MTTNLAFDFDSHHLARRDDPATSHIAASRVREFQAGHIGTILACLQDHGPQTIDEIAKRTHLTSVQVARRTADMQRLKLAEPTGTTRLSASGRPERVWSARA